MAHLATDERINRLVLSTKKSLDQQHKDETSVFLALSASFLPSFLPSHHRLYQNHRVFIWFDIAFDTSLCVLSHKRFMEITLSFILGSHEIALTLHGRPRLYSHEITHIYSPRDHASVRFARDRVSIVRCSYAGACLEKPLVPHQTVSP
jgi:hypothetical protein